MAAAINRVVFCSVLAVLQLLLLPLTPLPARKRSLLSPFPPALHRSLGSAACLLKFCASGSVRAAQVQTRPTAANLDTLFPLQLCSRSYLCFCSASTSLYQSPIPPPSPTQAHSRSTLQDTPSHLSHTAPSSIGPSRDTRCIVAVPWAQASASLQRPCCSPEWECLYDLAPHEHHRPKGRS